jgi:hypothetical protein
MTHVEPCDTAGISKAAPPSCAPIPSSVFLLIMNEGEVGFWAWFGGGGGVVSTHGEGL